MSVFRLMHTTPARLVSVFGGLWIVIYGAGLRPGYAFMLAIVGTAVAVTGIADICVPELLFARKTGGGPRSRERAA